MKIKCQKKRLSALRTVPVLAASVLALGLSSPGQAKPRKPGRSAAPSSKIVWQTDFAKAQAQAKKSGKPMFVDFFATWCGPCKGLEALVFPTPQFTKAARGYILVRVDGDKHPDLIQKYVADAHGSVNYPSMGFFAPSGKLLKLQVGVPVPAGETTAAGSYKAASFVLARLLTTYKSAR